MRSQRSARTGGRGRLAAAALLLFLASACAPSRQSLARDFPEATAVKVEVQDDGLLVDGAPSTLAGLGAAIEAAHRAKGGERKAVLLIAKFSPKPQESILDFERRKQTTMEEIYTALDEAGVRDLHLGPISKQ